MDKQVYITLDLEQRKDYVYHHLLSLSVSHHFLCFIALTVTNMYCLFVFNQRGEEGGCTQLRNVEYTRKRKNFTMHGKNSHIMHKNVITQQNGFSMVVIYTNNSNNQKI